MGVGGGTVRFVKCGWPWQGIEVVEGIEKWRSKLDLIINQVAYVMLTKWLLAKSAYSMIDRS